MLLHQTGACCAERCRRCGASTSFSRPGLAACPSGTAPPARRTRYRATTPTGAPRGPSPTGTCARNDQAQLPSGLLTLRSGQEAQLLGWWGARGVSTARQPPSG